MPRRIPTLFAVAGLLAGCVPADPPLGGVNDGTADATVAIRRLVDAGGDVVLPAGRYRITEPITIDLDETGITSIVGHGSATVIMAGPGPAFRFTGTHAGTADPSTVKANVWGRQRMPCIDGVEIVGAHPEACGIEAAGTMQFTVRRALIRKVKHGIRLTGRNRNVIISDCHIYENSGVGIFYDAVNLHQSNITNSHVSYNAGGGIVVRGGEVRNLHVGTCDVEANGSEDGPPTANVLLDATGGSLGEVAIVGCTIQHSHDHPGSANVRINAESNPVRHTEERRHGNFVVADNVLSDVRVNVDLLNVRGVTVTGNTMWKGYDHDVRARNCSGLVVAHNVFDRNPRYHYGDGADATLGMVFEDCDGCTISGNHLSGIPGERAAMTLSKCRRMNVTGCTILDSPGVGLLLEGVTDSRVSDCLIRNDRDDKAVSIRVTPGGSVELRDNSFGNSIDDEGAR